MRFSHQPSGRSATAVAPWQAALDPPAPESDAVASVATETNPGNQSVLGLADTLGPSQPLDAHTRQRMESAFGAGADFSRVQVHTGAEAGLAARGLSAQALTVGEHVAFAPGNYRPGTPVGDAMLAHELAHTVQQDGAPSGGAPALEPVGSPLEADADSATVSAMTRLWNHARGVTSTGFTQAGPALRAGLRVQRCSCGSFGPVQQAGDASGLGFQSRGFDAGVRGGLHVEDGGRTADVTARNYNAHGDVRVSGGTDALARHWQAGFLQTVVADDSSSRYVNGAGARVLSVRSRLFGPHRDGDPHEGLPWYGPETIQDFGSTDSEVSTEMNDTAVNPAVWIAHGAQLASMDGTTQFCSWLAVKQRGVERYVYLDWDTWEINWATEFDVGARSGHPVSGGGGRRTQIGAGRGPHQPVTTGQVAKDAVVVTEEWP